MSNITPTTNIPAPAGAVEVGEWCLDDGKARQFRGTKRDLVDIVGDLHVDIVGDQHVDGTIDRYIAVSGDVSVDAAAARVVARALIAAADEVEQMSGYDKVVVS